MPHPRVIAALCALAAACGGDPTPDPLVAGALDFAGHGPSNLVIIGVDTLRRDYVGRYGGASPHLDALLAGGVALDDHRSCSNWTFSALLCAMSGRSQLEMGYAPWKLGLAPPWIPLLPDALAEAGFRSALVSASTVVGDGTGYADRFDDFALVSPRSA